MIEVERAANGLSAMILHVNSVQFSTPRSDDGDKRRPIVLLKSILILFTGGRDPPSRACHDRILVRHRDDVAYLMTTHP